MEEVLKVPRPSDIDDWNLFQKFESNVIKKKRGDRGLLEWKRQRILEEEKREQHRREVLFQAEMDLERLRLREESMGKRGK